MKGGRTTNPAMIETFEYSRSESSNGFVIYKKEANQQNRTYKLFLKKIEISNGDIIRRAYMYVYNTEGDLVYERVEVVELSDNDFDRLYHEHPSITMKRMNRKWTIHEDNNIVGGFMYKGKSYKIYTGSRGGRYIMVHKKKVYVSA